MQLQSQHLWELILLVIRNTWLHPDPVAIFHKSKKEKRKLYGSSMGNQKGTRVVISCLAIVIVHLGLAEMQRFLHLSSQLRNYDNLYDRLRLIQPNHSGPKELRRQVHTGGSKAWSTSPIHPPGVLCPWCWGCPRWSEMFKVTLWVTDFERPQKVWNLRQKIKS